MTRSVLVIGPPLSGKSTWVKEHAQAGDLIWDFDLVHSALSLQDSHQHIDSIKPYVFVVRDAIFKRLREPGIANAWIISSSPEKSRVQEQIDQLDAQVMPLLATPEEAHRRADKTERPAAWHGYIDNWFAKNDWTADDFHGRLFEEQKRTLSGTPQILQVPMKPSRKENQMPWVINLHEDGPDKGRFCVHKENADGSAGEAIACHDTEKQAKAHQAALYANEPEANAKPSRPARPLRDDGSERRTLLVEDITLRTDEQTGAPLVEGYSSVFNSLSEVLFEWDNGRFREQVASGAFTKSLREQNVPLLVEHANLPLATTGSGTLKLTEDSHGLRFSSSLDMSDPDVQRLVPKMRRGDLNKCSFGFIPIRESWDEKTKPRTRTLHEVRLLDVSIVGRPAYPATEAKVRKALLDEGLDAESITDVLVRVRQGLPLEDNDVDLLRLLVRTCSQQLAEIATAPEVAPLLAEHPTESPQPAPLPSAPSPETHSLAWYRTRLIKLEGVI